MTAFKAAQNYVKDVLEDNEAGVCNFRLIDGKKLIYSFDITGRNSIYMVKMDTIEWKVYAL